MKAELLRESNNHSCLFIFGLVLLFVFTLTIHDHELKISEYYGYVASDVSHRDHTAFVCPACKINGNLKFENYVHIFFDKRFVFTVITQKYLLPSTFLTSNKPTRSPPTV